MSGTGKYKTAHLSDRQWQSKKRFISKQWSALRAERKQAILDKYARREE